MVNQADLVLDFNLDAQKFDQGYYITNVTYLPR